MAANAPPMIPKILLLCMEERFSDAFNAVIAAKPLPPSVSVTIISSALSFVPASTQFDTIVSPANSYGRLDGAFDDAISRALSPRDDYLALTRVAQATLYDRWRGFAPPGSCTLVKIPDGFHERSRNIWGTRRVALCPTMRTPQAVTWDREVVYEAIWSLLCAVDNHNRAVQRDEAANGDATQDETIRSTLMTPLATGIGQVSAERWASQAVLAIRHFVDAQENPGKWSKLEPGDIWDYADEVQETWTL